MEIGRKKIAGLNSYKTNHNVPIHASKGKSQKGGSKHPHMHDVDVFAHIVAKAAKSYVESTRPHAHDASIPEPLDHVTTDYQKLKNSVQRLLKKKMIEFPATTTVGAMLLNIKK